MQKDASVKRGQGMVSLMLSLCLCYSKFVYHRLIDGLMTKCSMNRRNSLTRRSQLYLEMEDLEAILEDCLDIVKNKNLKENFTLQ